MISTVYIWCSRNYGATYPICSFHIYSSGSAEIRHCINIISDRKTSEEILSYAVSIAVHIPYTSEASCNPQMIACTNHGIWIQSIPLCTVLSWQLRRMFSWGQHHTQSKTSRTVTHRRGLAISNVMNLVESLCLMPWCLQGHPGGSSALISHGN